MKICFITATLAGGGAERVIANLANELNLRGHQVTILLTTDNVVEYVLAPEVQVIQISSKTSHSIKGRLRRVGNLREYFKEHRDVHYISLPTDTSIFVLLASLFIKIKLIVSVRNDPNKYEHPIIRDILFCLVKKIVFQTEDARACFSKRLQRIGTIIFNPVSEALPPVYSGDRKKTIVAVGRLDEQKSHNILINAFTDFAKKYPDYELNIYGRGPLEEKLLRQIREAGLEEKIHLLGFSKNVWKSAADAAMYILPSDYEGIPNSLLEAMAMGMPVISTDCPIGGPAMLIEHEVNGLLVPVGDSRQLYLAMCRLADNPKLAEKYAAEAKKIRERMSVKQICDEWLEYIEK